MKKLVAVAAMVSMNVFAGGYGAKYIVCGWDTGRADPETILKYAADFDKLACDGMAIPVRGNQDGVELDSGWIMADPGWSEKTFESLVPIYRQITAHKSLRESFLSCGMSARTPKGKGGDAEKKKARVSLDDDAAWARIANNYRVLAKLAKAGGLCGLLIDNEDYHGTHQFDLQPGDGDYESASRKMRARGRQVFKGIFEVFPDVRLLFFWAFSNGRTQSMQPDTLAALKESGRMFPAFLNGMLDVIPPTAVFIDGDEDSYTFRAADGMFEKAFVQILSGVIPYVAPENRAKYRAQVRNSFGLYLDQYVGSKYRIRAGKRGQPNNWYRAPVYGSRDVAFREDLEAATRCADEYVWIYGERFSFIDWGKDLDDKAEPWNAIKTRETWEERLRLNTKMRLVKEPDRFLADELVRFRNDPRADNLLSRVKPRGGSFITTEQITNRNYFAVSVDVKDAESAPILRWQRGTDWNWSPNGVRNVPLKSTGPAQVGWTTYTALLRVPEAGNRFHLQCGDGHEIRNAALYRLDPPPKRLFQLAYQLDISRGKVPTMTSLKRIVDIIAGLGYTQFQLYMECAFAYKGHEAAWENRSPMTAAEMRDLFDYCAGKGVELVPSQNSFAHMGPWFEVESYCKKLAECPNGVVIDMPKLKKTRGPVTLIASGAASLTFLAGLYDQLLPCCPGRYFNIGCDEVYDLLDVKCRSAQKVKKEGYARTYFDHVLAVRNLAYARQRDSMFWADAVFEYPELIRDIPQDMVALVYGYTAGGNDKFAEKCETLAADEIRFFVCPGTSGWCGPSGRTKNMLGNVKEAFDAGRKYGAEGLMVCDWGDGGHHQPWIVALPSLIYASGLVRGKDRSRAELAEEIDRICGAKVGEALLRYGDVWEKTLDMRHLFRAYTDRNAKPVPDEAFVVWREAQSLVRLDGAPEWVKDDFKTMDLLFRVIEGFSKSQPLDCDKLESTYRALWIKQNREGGLFRSLDALRKE